MISHFIFVWVGGICVLISPTLNDPIINQASNQREQYYQDFDDKEIIFLYVAAQVIILEM